MNQSTVRTAVLSAFGIVALSGCSAAVPAASPPAAPLVTVEDKGAPGTLTFDDGAALGPDAIAQWSEELFADPGWSLTSPDEGGGTWGYTTVDGTCTADFWQGKVFDMTATDDRAASDFVIAAIAGVELAKIQDLVNDNVVGFIFSDNPTAEYRRLGGTTPEHSQVIAVRGFAQLKAALYVVVDCASDQATTVADEVLSMSAIHVID